MWTQDQTARVVITALALRLRLRTSNIFPFSRLRRAVRGNSMRRHEMPAEAVTCAESRRPRLRNLAWDVRGPLLSFPFPRAQRSVGEGGRPCSAEAKPRLREGERADEGSLFAKENAFEVLACFEKERSLLKQVIDWCRSKPCCRLDSVYSYTSGILTSVSIKGSHHKFRKGAVTIIVPHPKKDLPAGTARAIAKDAGWL